MTGRTIDPSTSGLTSVGPGRKYLPNSDNAAQPLANVNTLETRPSLDTASP